MSPYLWAVIIGTLIPAVTEIVTKSKLSGQVRTLIAGGLSAVGGALSGALSNGELNGAHWQLVLATTLAAFGATVIADVGAWQPSGASKAIRAATSNVGIG